MEEAATIPTLQGPGARMTPFTAFERLCLEVIEIEAVANAASAAIDACAPPADSRMSFDRAQALIGAAAEKATDALTLVDQLKAAVHAYVGGLR